MIGIKSDLTIQQFIRDEILKIAESGELFNDLPLINSWNDVFDNAVSSGRNNFQMIGSRKPNHFARTFFLKTVYSRKKLQ